MVQNNNSAHPARKAGETSGLHVAIGAGTHGKSTLCVAPIAAGETVFRVTGRIVSHQNRYTLQVGTDRHLAPEGELWAFVNHACDPNCLIVFDSAGSQPETVRMVARRTIAPGEEITFNYLTTEWDMAAPFDCRCGAACCAGAIRGFRYLARPAREAMQPLLAPFLAGQIEADPFEAEADRAQRAAQAR